MQLSYELSAADMGAAQTLFWRRRRPLFFWGFSFYGLLAFLFGVWQLIRGVGAFAPVSLLSGAWMMTFIPFLVPRSARKSWEKLRYLHGATTLTTSNEGLEMTNPMTRSFLRWEAVDNVLEGPNVWLLFVGPMHFYIIPTRAFASQEEQGRFRSELHRIGALSPSGSAPIASP